MLIPHPTRATNPTQWVRKVMRWAQNVAGGKEDRCKTVRNAVFVEGETIESVSTRVATLGIAR
jgi:hypothetical protein